MRVKVMLHRPVICKAPSHDGLVQSHWVSRKFKPKSRAGFLYCMDANP